MYEFTAKFINYFEQQGERPSPYRENGEPDRSYYYVSRQSDQVKGLPQYHSINDYLNSDTHKKVDAQYQQGISALQRFLRRHAPDSSDKAIADLATFLERREKGFFSSNLETIDGEAKRGLDSLMIDIENEGIPLDTRVDTVRELADGLIKCGMGAGSNMTMHAQDLRLRSEGAMGALRLAWEYLFREHLLKFVAIHHGGDEPGNEIHRVNMYHNHWCKKYNISPRRDDFHMNEIGERLFQACDHYLKVRMLPEAALVKMGEDCYEEISTPFREMQGKALTAEEAYEVSKKYVDGMEVGIRMRFGEIPSFLVVNEFHGPEGRGSKYFVIDSPVLLLRQIMRNLVRENRALKKTGKLPKFKIGDGKIVRLIANNMAYVKQRKKDAVSQDQFWPTRAQDLPPRSTPWRTDLLGAALVNTSDPRHLHRISVEEVWELACSDSNEDWITRLASRTIRRYRESNTVFDTRLVELAVSRLEFVDDEIKINALVKAIKGSDDTLSTAIFDKIYQRDYINQAGNSILHLAAQYGLVKLTSAMLRYMEHCFHEGNYRVSDLLQTLNHQGLTPLMSAAANSTVELVSTILQSELVKHRNRSKFLNLTDTHGRNALCHAIAFGKPETVQFLLDWQVALLGHDRDGKTPLMLAAKRANREIFDIVIGALKDLAETNQAESVLFHLSEKDLFGDSALMYAASEKMDIPLPAENEDEDDADAAERPKCMLEILIDMGASLHVVGRQETTPLHIAAHAGATEVVRVLLNLGVDLEAVGRRRTALQIAASAGHLDIVQQLLDRGAEINVDLDSGASPLWYAAQGGHEKVVRLLAKIGAIFDAEAPGLGTPLWWAIQNDRVKVAETLISIGASIDRVGRDNEPLLNFAAVNSPDSAAALIDHGADIHAFDRYGRTALLAAASAGIAVSASLLLRCGANVDAQSFDRGFTALMYAAERGDEVMTGLLLKAGADPRISDVNGYTASDAARFAYHPDVARSLRNAERDWKAHNGMPPDIRKNLPQVEETLFVNKDGKIEEYEEYQEYEGYAGHDGNNAAGEDEALDAAYMAAQLEEIRLAEIAAQVKVGTDADQAAQWEEAEFDQPPYAPGRAAEEEGDPDLLPDFEDPADFSDYDPVPDDDEQVRRLQEEARVMQEIADDSDTALMQRRVAEYEQAQMDLAIFESLRKLPGAEAVPTRQSPGLHEDTAAAAREWEALKAMQDRFNAEDSPADYEDGPGEGTAAQGAARRTEPDQPERTDKDEREKQRAAFLRAHDIRAPAQVIKPEPAPVPRPPLNKKAEPAPVNKPNPVRAEGDKKAAPPRPPTPPAVSPVASPVPSPVLSEASDSSSSDDDPPPANSAELRAARLRALTAVRQDVPVAAASPSPLEKPRWGFDNLEKKPVDTGAMISPPGQIVVDEAPAERANKPGAERLRFLERITAAPASNVGPAAPVVNLPVISDDEASTASVPQAVAVSDRDADENAHRNEDQNLDQNKDQNEDGFEPPFVSEKAWGKRPAVQEPNPDHIRLLSENTEDAPLWPNAGMRQPVRQNFNENVTQNVDFERRLYVDQRRQRDSRPYLVRPSRHNSVPAPEPLSREKRRSTADAVMGGPVQPDAGQRSRTSRAKMNQLPEKQFASTIKTATERADKPLYREPERNGKVPDKLHPATTRRDPVRDHGKRVYTSRVIVPDVKPYDELSKWEKFKVALNPLMHRASLDAQRRREEKEAIKAREEREALRKERHEQRVLRAAARQNIISGTTAAPAEEATASLPRDPEHRHRHRHRRQETKPSSSKR